MKHDLLFKQNDNCLLTTNNGSSVVKSGFICRQETEEMFCYLVWE